MVKLNTKPLKSDMHIQKNVLYQINGNTTVSVREEHKDCTDTETVNLRYVLEDGQYCCFIRTRDIRKRQKSALRQEDLKEKNFLKVAEFLEGLSKWQKPWNIQPLLWYKLKNNLMPYVSASAKIRNFAENKVCICGYFYHLQVYLLERIENCEYAVSIEIGLDI